MDVPVLLIADSNPEFRHALAQALKRCYCVHCCGTGTEALRLLRALRPEILVLDLTIPEVDGLTLLQMAVSEGLRPRVLAITPLVSNYILESADELGVGYMMRQPCDARLVVRQVNELRRCLRASEADALAYVADLLQTLGLAGRQKGTRCIPAAVIAAARSPDQSVTKELYPEVGRSCVPRAAGDVVEKRIRYSIHEAWERRDPEVWAAYFPKDKKPTNSEFISRMVEALADWRRKD